MGFIKEVYSNERAGLVVAFGRGQTSNNYFNGDSVEEAMKHFNLYLKGNEMYIRTENETAIATLGIEKEDAVEFRSTIDAIITALTDEQAISAPILFPIWKENIEYKAGDRVRYQGKLYKVLQDHTSQNTWLPITASSLYASLLTDEETGEILEWIQPDSTNGYSKGDKVFYGGKVWVSLLDNNAYEPGVNASTWEESIEPWMSNFAYAKGAKVFYEENIYISLNDDNLSSPTAEASLWVLEGTEIISSWVSGTSYMIGNKVIYEDQTYESLIDNNVWSPIEYPAGWNLME